MRGLELDGEVVDVEITLEPALLEELAKMSPAGEPLAGASAGIPASFLTARSRRDTIGPMAVATARRRSPRGAEQHAVRAGSAILATPGAPTRLKPLGERAFARRKCGAAAGLHARTGTYTSHVLAYVSHPPPSRGT
jgi:hypothetical protein